MMGKLHRLGIPRIPRLSEKPYILEFKTVTFTLQISMILYITDGPGNPICLFNVIIIDLI